MSKNISIIDKGKVYGWGNSEYGQLPVREDSYQVNIATELNTRELGHITDIAAGGCFCMILNSKYYNINLFVSLMIIIYDFCLKIINFSVCLSYYFLLHSVFGVS